MKKWFCNSFGCNRKVAINRCYGYCTQCIPRQDCLGCGNPLRSDNTIGYHGRCRPGSLRHALYPQDQERHRERTSEWKRANPDKVRLQTDRRRALKMGAFVEDIDLFIVWARDNGFCWCGTPADPEDWWLEHMVPLDRGGLHSYENVHVSHPVCNLRKGTKLLSELSEGRQE